MFIALAIICDEFFVPSLEVITHRMEISCDVAGATFMAAGGSAPELFTSIVGVFFAKSDVGVGTIVGSAVFNILFVIGACAVVSKEPLTLTWWPLFRDCVFYLISLTVLIVTFTDYEVQLYESLILIAVYVLYVIFMANNKTIELYVKRLLRSSIHSPGRKVSPLNSESSRSVQAVVNCMSDPDRIKVEKTTFSLGMIQLIMHSLDPLTQETNAKEMVQLYAASSFTTKNKTSPEDGNAGFRAASTSDDGVAVAGMPGNHREMSQKKVTAVVRVEQGVEVVANQSAPNHTTLTLSNHENGHIKTARSDPLCYRSENGKDNKLPRKSVDADLESRISETAEAEKEEQQHFDMSWPNTTKKRCLYLFILPITLPLFLTLPDVRKPERERWFMVTFSISILWIGFFTYLMVWWAHQVVETTGLSETMMGLTFLAAGTSVPDLITSVIVARKGRGDMAVSSSVGSNIFDVTIGLPFPWAMATLIHFGQTVEVESNGLFCSVFLLAVMLLLVVACIARNGWQMTKRLGVILFFLYVVFLIFSLLIELKHIECPVSIPKH